MQIISALFNKLFGPGIEQFERMPESALRQLFQTR